MKGVGDIVEVLILVSFLVRLVVMNLHEKPVGEEKAKSTYNHCKKQVVVVKFLAGLFPSLFDRCIH